MVSDKDKILLGIAVILLIAPLFGPGVSATENRLGNDAPTNCIEAPDPRHTPTSTRGSASVTGRIQQNTSNFTEYRITYNTTQAGYRFTVTPPEGVSVLDSHGFEKTRGEYEWNREADHPWIKFQLGEPMEGFNYTGGSGWLISPIPKHNGHADVKLKPQEQGFIGNNLLLVGNHTTYSKRVGCQGITLVVPEGTSLKTSPERILEMYVRTAENLDIGGAYDEVRIYVSPRDTGMRKGSVPLNDDRIGNEAIVDKRASIHSPENTWIHEYVHTRQQFHATEGLQWFYEGSATYYAARLSLEQGLITPREYDAALAQWNQFNSTAHLNEVRREQLAYKRGAVVLSRVDGELQSSTNRSLMAFMRDSNSESHQHPERVTQAHLENYVQQEPEIDFQLHQAVFTNSPVSPSFVFNQQPIPWYLRALLGAIGRPPFQFIYPVIIAVFGWKHRDLLREWL